MAAFGRLMFILLIGLSIIYVCLSLYARASRRAALEAEWDAAGGPGQREAYVAEGLEAYQGSLRRKLLWGVYVVPLTLIALLVYVTNFM